MESTIYGISYVVRKVEKLRQDHSKRSQKGNWNYMRHKYTGQLR